ncbi:MAG: YdeI/OmpD-associated family protein [Burkholderiaceae bacterium]
MATTDPRVDAYIERAAPFAHPILAQLRGAVHSGCPAVVETIKWGMPFYMHADRILANMAAFKQHCSFRFWNGREAAERGKSAEAMGQFGRLTTLRDLPPRRELVLVVKQAVALIDAGTTRTRAAKPRSAAAQPDMPAELAHALARHTLARQTFEALSPSQRREYVDWIVEAKRDETRARRLAQALEWLAEGKSRHWKYQGG